MINYLGPCFGTNGHSRRATDVISTLSKSTIEDLSFYLGFVKELIVKTVALDERIGFARIGSRIKDLGSCFGRNEHPGRDTDVISRLSTSTIDDLSFSIGFTMELLASRILDLVLA